MKLHHTKSKGDLGVLKAQADLCEKGFLICFPLTEHAPFDIVIYKDYEFKRVQVKTRSIDRHGCISVRYESSYSDSKKVNIQKADLKEIDVYCIYCLDNDKCYYFNPHMFQNETTLALRVKTPRNNQIAKIKFADDYREVP